MYGPVISVPLKEVSTLMKNVLQRNLVATYAFQLEAKIIAILIQSESRGTNNNYWQR